MTEYLTFHNILLGLLILSGLWLIIVLFKRQNENLTRSLLLTIFFGAALLFTDHYQIKRLTFAEIKNQVFPASPKVMFLDYDIERGQAGQDFFTAYIFKEPYPKISVTMDVKGRYFHFESDRDIQSLNDVLAYLKLPKVDKGARELISITGRQLDIYHYRWDDYPDGILLVERDRCQNKNSLNAYHCLKSLSITKKY
jgi:hypothetical protein